MKILKLALLALGFLGFVGVHQALAQSDTFMLVPGIKGSSVEARHRDWIEVVSLTQTLERGQERGRGTPPQCTLEVIKNLDISGPLLWGAAVTGQVFGEIQIDVQKPGDKGQIFYQIMLRNAHVTSISTIGNGGYIERVTLDAGSVQLKFFPQKPDGSLGTPVMSSFSC